MTKRVSYLDIKRMHEPIMEELHEALENVVQNGWVVLGNELLIFEKEFAKYSDSKYCVGVANGLDAIILSLLALGIKEGDEIIVPSNTYIATLFAITRVGASPILVEPNPKTYNIDPRNIEAGITKKTKAIIPVHLFGQACEMDEIMEIAKKHNLFVVEDNAQSHGAMFNHKKTGGFGDINATSFYPGKNLGALGDGGGITTNILQYDKDLRILRNYGEREKYYNDVIGYNSRLDELQAAFLRIKIRNLDKNNKIRQNIGAKYVDSLSGVGDLIMPETARGATHVYHVFTIRTKKRDNLREYLKNREIVTLVHYPVPPHLQKAYGFLGFKKGDFPIAEKLAETSLSIPIYPELTQDEQEYVITAIKDLYEG